MPPDEAEETPALVTAALSKAYGPHTVLDGITVRVSPGEIAAVSGPTARARARCCGA
jgi:ABC-type multidrug transport system ATPase subunit